MANSWFSVDKEGLRKLTEHREKSAAVFELIQNAWDTDATKVAVTIEPIPNSPTCWLTVEDDDPNGFQFLEHAYTLFAESVKKGDPTKRGRFNLGEKLVLSICTYAEVISTKGKIIFAEDGTRKRAKEKREKGSLFRAKLRIRREELTELSTDLRKLIPPPSILTTINGSQVFPRDPVATFEEPLPTLISNAEGVLTRTVRKTKISVYEVLSGETASIYELGIPVVETGDLYHVDIHQKVPLNMDRDNVPPKYLQQVRTYVLNHTVKEIATQQASATWITNALGSESVKPEAVTEIVAKRFGEKRAIFDPSDPEANNNLVAQGYTVIPGRTFDKDTWSNIRSSGAALPSGVIAPTPKPYSTDPTAPAVKFIPREEWSQGMLQVEGLVLQLSSLLLDTRINMRIVDTGNSFNACYVKSHKEVHFNLRHLGKDWFNPQDNLASIIDLTLHEFGHYFESNHLSDKYNEALTKMAGKLVVAVLRNPELLR